MSATRDERIQVLEMVAAGQITADEGNQLLEALGGGGASDRDPAAGAGRAWSDTETRRSERPSRRQKVRSHGGFEKLTEARIHGVTPSFVQEMHDVGFPNLTLGELIELRIHGVNGAFVREMHDAGFRDLSVHELAELRIHGVDAGFIREMAEAGLSDLTLEQLTEARIHGMNAAFIRDMRDMGLVDPTFDRAIDLQDEGRGARTEGETGDLPSRPVNGVQPSAEE